MDYLKKLQSKPYEEKIRILKIASLITIILVLIIWGVTLKVRETESGDTSKLQNIWQNVKEFKSKFDD